MKNWMFALVLCMGSVTTFAGDTSDGAVLFHDRCVLCHGVGGMGEGILPLKIKDYPKTNLLDSPVLSREEITKVITHGNDETKAPKLMPPMKDELSSAQIAALTDFVIFLRDNNKEATAQLKVLAAKVSPNKRTGEHLYATRCVLCHGKSATGDGRMAKVIKSPPPANLITSKADLNYIKKIVEHGGQAMGRSPQMPPWGDQFSESEIESIALYILDLRETSN